MGYYYECGPNNVLQNRPIDLTPICVAKSSYDCLTKSLGAFEVGAVEGNLYKASCEYIDALIQCGGWEMSECKKAAIQIACRTVVGGATRGLTGALAGLGSGLKGSVGCLCDLISKFLDWLDFDIPEVHLRGGPSGGGWSIGFTPVFNSFGGSEGGCGPASISASSGTAIFPVRPAAAYSAAAPAPGGVCARVRIRLNRRR